MSQMLIYSERFDVHPSLEEPQLSAINTVNADQQDIYLVMMYSMTLHPKVFVFCVCVCVCVCVCLCVQCLRMRVCVPNGANTVPALSQD